MMFVRYLWPSVLWTLFILVLTLIPGESLPSVGLFQVDKLVHIFFFFVLMILSSYNLKQVYEHWPLSISSLLVSSVYSVGLGTGIEIAQRVVPGRNFSLLDILANCIGVGAGYFVFVFL